MDILDRLLAHDAWTTRQILERCRELSTTQIRAKFGAGHESVHETLVHMIGNVRVWTDLMSGEIFSKTGSAWDELSLEALIERHEAASADFAALATGVRNWDRLDELWIDQLDDPPTAKTFGGAIAHVLTHNMHHRCELLHMLSRLGLSGLPEGDVLSWEATLST